MPQSPNVRQNLAHRIRGSLKPLRAFRCLFSGENLNEAIRKVGEAIGLSDVPVERGRVVLRQHKHAQHIGVDAIGNRHVDQTVFPAQRNSRFGSLLREREKARSGTSAKYYCEQFAAGWHSRFTDFWSWNSAGRIDAKQDGDQEGGRSFIFSMGPLSYTTL